jgi:hypothetical protein
MTKERELRDLLPPGIEIRPGIYHHPRSPDASLERLHRVLGSIKLTGPVPPHDLFDDDDEDEEEVEEGEQQERAGR